MNKTNTPTPQTKTREELRNTKIGKYIEGAFLDSEDINKLFEDLNALLTRREQEVAREIKKAIEYLPKDKALGWIDYHYLTPAEVGQE